MPLIGWLFLVIFLGIANAAHLHWQYLKHRSHGREMVCPLGGRCEEVVGSEYGFTFGMKNERIGLLYYGSLLAGLLVFAAYDPWSEFAGYAVLLASGVAVLFSTYLLVVQIFVLREYCSWCIVATFINYLIFALEIPVILQ